MRIRGNVRPVAAAITLLIGLLAVSAPPSAGEMGWGVSPPFHLDTTDDPVVLLASVFNAVAGGEVFVRAGIQTDTHPVTEVSLHYAVNGGPEQTEEAGYQGDGVWTALLGEHAGGTEISWRLVALDEATNEAFWPRDGGYLSFTVIEPGSAVAWGRCQEGQCDVPVPNNGFVGVEGGGYHTVGLMSDGSIQAWGVNNFGQCNVPAPNQYFVALASGYHHSLGLKADGSIVAWGWNNDGQLTVPAPNTGFAAAAGGTSHSLGLKIDGSIVTWGNDEHGQDVVPEPNEGFVAIAAGSQHNLGLRLDGSVVAWGLNSQGQCTVPVPNADFVAISGGEHHSLGLKSDGSVVAWGNNSDGQCSIPQPNADFIAVAAGYYHSLGLRSDGTVVAWGRNEYGESDEPLPNAGFVSISGGQYHSLGLTNPVGDLGACCFHEGPCEIVTEDSCQPMYGEWMGIGTVCDPDPCPLVGACCLESGDCEPLTEFGCQVLFGGHWFAGDCLPDACRWGACCHEGPSCEVEYKYACSGLWMGAHTFCFPNPCPGAEGACCFDDGSCQFVLEADCPVGDWLGMESACDPNPCDQLGACCHADGTCQYVLEVDCETDDWRALEPCEPNPCPQPNKYLIGGATTGAPGDTISVSIIGEIGQEIKGYSINLMFDPDVFDFVSSTLVGTLGEDPYYVVDSCTDYSYRIGVVYTLECPGIPAGSGDLLLVELRIRETAQIGMTHLSIEDDPPSLNRMTDCDGMSVVVEGGQFAFDVMPGPGACCFPDGSCELVTEVDCAAQDGVWEGMATVCEPNPCDQLGACCQQDGSCQFVLETECETDDWRMLEPCDPNPCPQLNYYTMGGATTGVVGETVTVAVVGVMDQEIKGYSISLLFDQDVFEVVSITLEGTLGEGAEWPLLEPTEYSIRAGVVYVLTCPGIPAGSGDLLLVNLRIKDTAQLGVTHFSIQDDPPTLNRMTDCEGVSVFVTGGVFEFEVLDPSDVELLDLPAERVQIRSIHPNPTTGQIYFGIDLPSAGRVTVRVVDVTGKVVTTLVNRDFGAGSYLLSDRPRTASGGELQSGVYFLYLDALGERQVRKFIVTR